MTPLTRSNRFPLNPLGRTLLATLILGVMNLRPMPLTAQYIFVDANKDGRNSELDLIPHSGWSELDIWLDPMRNRDGSKAIGLAGTEMLEGYEMVLEVGSVIVSMEWGEYVSAHDDARIVQGPFREFRTMYVAVDFARPQPMEKQRLGTIRLRPTWGLGELTFLPCKVLENGAVGTSLWIGPKKVRHRLGPTVDYNNSAVIAGEWQDADGASFNQEPLASAGPVRAEGGALYLGWRRMKAPYDLRIVRGRAVVNGMSLPERKQKMPPVTITNQDKARHYAGVSSGAVGRTLHQLGVDDSTVYAGMITAYKESRAVDSVAVEGTHLRLYRKGLDRPYLAFSGPPRWSDRSVPWKGPESAMAEVLEQWANLLQTGGLLRIMDVGSYMTGGDPAPLDAAIRKLRSGKPLSPEDSSALRGAEPSLDWSEVAQPPPLERVVP